MPDLNYYGDGYNGLNWFSFNTNGVNGQGSISPVGLGSWATNTIPSNIDRLQLVVGVGGWSAHFPFRLDQYDIQKVDVLWSNSVLSVAYRDGDEVRHWLTGTNLTGPSGDYTWANGSNSVTHFVVQVMNPAKPDVLPLFTMGMQYGFYILGVWWIVKIIRGVLNAPRVTR